MLNEVDVYLIAKCDFDLVPLGAKLVSLLGVL